MTARLGLTEGVDATFDPPWADQCGEAGRLHPGIPLHGPRSRPRNRARSMRAMIAKARDAVVRYDNTGVRIEDDYLVTPNGAEWLSRAPREIAEIESAVAGR